jgi:hypothetical protein
LGRAKISTAVAMPDRLSWLFGEGEAPPDRALASVDEFEEACTLLLDNWQVLPVTAPRLFAWAAPKLRKSAIASALRDRIASVDVFARIQLQVGARFARALRQAQVPYALLKGSAVRFTAYANPTERCGHDIDIVTWPKCLRRAEQVAIGIGFVPSQWSAPEKRFVRADPELRARVEAGHYELGFLVRRQAVDGLAAEVKEALRREAQCHHLWHETDDGRLACFVSTDIHHALSLDLPADDLLRTARSVEVGDGQAFVPSPAWLACHLIFKIYWEGVHTYRKGLYQFADLQRHVRTMSAEDIVALLDILALHRLEAAGYYVLRRLEIDLGETLPDRLTAFLDAQAFAPAGDEVDARMLNDLGDMWPKLWGYR